MINIQMTIIMAFNDYSSMIRNHSRSFLLIPKSNGVRDPDTSRFRKGGNDTAIKCQGVFETVTEKDFKKYPDFEITSGDLKLITTPEMIKKHEPQVKEEINYNGKPYWINKVLNRVHYGNFYVIFLKEEEISV